MPTKRRYRRRYNPDDFMVEEYILSQLPMRDNRLFRKLGDAGIPYDEWNLALRQLFRDGCIAYDNATFIHGDGQKHSGWVAGIGVIW